MTTATTATKERPAEYLNVTAVAAKFGCSPGTLRNLRGRGAVFVPVIGGGDARPGRGNRLVRYHRRQVGLMELVLQEQITLEAANVQWAGILAGMGNGDWRLEIGE